MFKKLTDFLMSAGTGQVEHTGKTYLGHAIGVYRDLEVWNADNEICRAGMFHSIYGTERFQRFALPLTQRKSLRQLIGQRAEQLAYWNCAMDRPAFDRLLDSKEGPYCLLDRFIDQRVELSKTEFDDLCRIHLCDWLEQVGRCGQWDYRRHAYRRMADRLGGIAKQAFARVYAQAPSEAQA